MSRKPSCPEAFSAGDEQRPLLRDAARDDSEAQPSSRRWKPPIDHGPFGANLTSRSRASPRKQHGLRGNCTRPHPLALQSGPLSVRGHPATYVRAIVTPGCGRGVAGVEFLRRRIVAIADLNLQVTERLAQVRDVSTAAGVLSLLYFPMLKVRERIV